MDKNLQKFKLVAEHAPIHIVFTDTEGTVLYANKMVEEITGYKRDEIIGNNPRLWGRQMDKSFYKNFWKVIKSQKKVFSGEIQNRRKSGVFYTASVRVAPAIGEDGELLGFVGIERDITKEKQSDQAKTEFVSLASHQLKNPLAVNYLHVEMLLKEKAGKLTRKQKETLHKIKSANEKMLDLINSLLDVSKVELGKFVIEPQPTDLIRMTKSVIKEFKPKIEQKKIKLEMNYLNIAKTVWVDQKLLTIILQNLISNAVKYTPDKGEIKLEISVEKKNLKIQIADTGYGIPKSEQHDVFARSFRASNIKKGGSEGTGLGMYLLKSILDQVKGKIWFESEENKGTVFYVILPIMKL